MHRSAIFPILGLTLLLDVSLGAQQFGKPGSDRIPSGDLPCPIGVVDLDGDGAPDLLDSTPELWRNLGDGHFAAPSRLGSQFHAYRFREGDLDGNGETDLLWYGSGVTPLIQMQRAGRFVDHSEFSLHYAEDIRLGDVDGDGDQDVVQLSLLASLTGVYLFDAPARLTRNPNSGFPAGSSHSDNPQHAELADLDGDGDLDLVLLHQDRLEVLANDGSGRFTERQELPIASGQSGPMRCADLNGDSAPDILFVSHTGDVTVVINDGNGRLAGRPSGIASRMQTPLDVDVVDLDADGDLDLALAQDALVGHINDGTGRFGATRILIPNWSGEQQAHFADFDQDGRQDLFVDRGPTLCLQSDAGDFVRAGGSAWPRTTDEVIAPVSGDFDGDGHADLFHLGGARGVLWLGDGRQNFVDASRRLPGSHVASVSAAIGDLEGDGDLDIVLGRFHGPNQILINDGSGTFRRFAGGMDQRSDVTPAIAIGDLDGDDLAEVVQSGSLGGVVIWRNRMPADFVPDDTALPTDARGARSIRLADLDGDDDLDLLLGFTGVSHPPTAGHVRRFDNDGAGNFREVPGGLVGGNGQIDVVDLNGDGFVDLVTSDRVYENDGQGGLTLLGTNRMPRLPLDDSPMVVGDFDGDGCPDLMTAAGNGHVLHNDGAGSFQDVTGSWMAAGFDTMEPLLSIDVDADGDADLLVGGTRGNALWVSRARDLQIRELPRTGNSIEFELSAYGRPGSLVWLFFATGPDALRDLPGIGRLRLDPGTLLPGVSVTLRPDGPTRIAASIPADSNLVGLRFDTQALIGSSPVDARLTNAVAVTVLR